MNIIADRVKERISGSPGTSSTLTLSAAPIGFRRFSSVMSIGDTCYAVIENGAAWEIGIYTYSAANTLTRTTVLKSSNSGALISVGSNAFVFISYIADKAVYLNPSGEANLALSALNDVGLTAPASGQSLVYNGSSWANTTITGYTTEEAQDAVGGILTDTSSISFSYNDGAPSIAASVKNSGVTNDMLATGIDALKIGSGTVSSAEFGYLDGVTSSLQVQLDSKYDSANPSGYISASGVAAAYQPLDADLTSLAAASGSGIYERSGGSWTPVVIGTGLSLGSGTLSNTLDLSSYLTSSVASGTYLPLAGGTLTGDLKFTDATYDIGKSGLTRPRDGFFSRNLTVGGTSTFDGGGYVPNTTSLAFQCISPFQASTASIYGTYCSIGNGVGLGFSSAGTPIAKLGSGAGTVSFELNGTSAIGANGGYNCKLIGGSIDFAVGTFLSHTTGLSLSSVGLYGAGNTLKIVNSTNAQTFDLFNTYTSATSLEAFRIKAVAAAAYQIGSAIGSAGGTNRAIEIGHYNSGGTFTSALSIATTGDATFAKSITVTKGAGAYTSTFNSGSSSDNYNQFVGSSGSLVAEYGLYAGYLYFQSLTGLSGTRFYSNNTISAQFTSAGVTLSQGVATSGSPTTLTVTGAAHTTLTLSTEATDVNFNLSRTVQFATGALTTQRAMRIQAPTYSFVGASTITTASTLSISGSPVAGTNATITNAYALNVESGNVNLGGSLVIGGLTIANGAGSSGACSITASTFTSAEPYLMGYAWHFAWIDVVPKVTIDPASLGVKLASNMYLGFGATTNSRTGTADTLLYRDGAGILAQRNGTNAQTLRVYNTYTSSTSYETLNLKGKASANFEIGPENGSAGGTLRGLTIGGYAAGTSTIAPWLTFTNAGVATFGSCSTVREFNVTGVSYFERGGSTMWFEINPNYALAANTAAFDASKAMAFYVNSGIAPFLALSIATTGLSTFAGPIASTKAIYFTSEPTGTPAGTTQTLTLADGNHQTLALTSATGTVTATLTVPTGSSSGTIIVKQHASAAKDITWAVSAGTIKWMGTQPTWSSDAVSAVRLVSWRWDGSIMYLAATDVGT